MGLWLCLDSEDYFPEGLLCLQLQPIKAVSQERRKFPTIEHGMCPVEKGGEFPFNMAILLRNTWVSILKLNTHSFLFENSFKILISSSITILSIPDQNTILSFLIFDEF